MFWIQFIISSAAIIFAGIKLTGYADIISDRLNLGKVWIGVILLGLVTSLPEAITSLTSIVLLNANNLAIGNLLGSDVFNPMIIVLLDIVYRKDSITNIVKVNSSQNISGYFAIALISIVFLEILFGSNFNFLHIGKISAGLVAIAILFIIGMKLLSSQGQHGEDKMEDGVQNQVQSLFLICLKALIASAIIIAASIFLSTSADAIAYSTGLGRTFVGSIFLALATSLPEIVVSVSALNIGSMDLAIGNIFGSNMINMFIVPLCGLFVKGDIPVLWSVSKAHSITAITSIILMAIILLSINKKKRTVFSLGIDSIAMIVTFFTGMGILYYIK